jgi:hypothetical protein
MGNSIAGAGSSAAKVQQLIKGRYSTSPAGYSANSGEALRQTLSEVASICAEYENTPDLAKAMGSKEIKFGLQIAGELVDMSLEDRVSLPARLCALEALQAVLALQPVCKRAAEDCLPRLLQALQPAFVELFIGTLGVALKVFRALEDDAANAGFFQVLVKCGCIQKFFIFVTQASVAGTDNMLCASIVILDIIYWSFSRHHATLTALRPAVRRIAFQHRDSLFELSRHPVRKLSYLTTMLLIRLMASADKITCSAIQVTDMAPVLPNKK